MTIHRRLFLGGILASTFAPAIVRSGVLMPVRPAIILPSGLALLDQMAKIIEERLIAEAQQRQSAIVNELYRMQVTHGAALGEYGFVKGDFRLKRVVLNEDWMA